MPGLDQEMWKLKSHQKMKKKKKMGKNSVKLIHFI